MTIFSGVVRKQLGLSFKGESWPYPLIFGDLEIQGLEEKVRNTLSDSLARIPTLQHSTGTAGVI